MMKPNLPATHEETNALTFARDFLREARAANFLELGDPFGSEALHKLLRRVLHNLADWHPRNTARVLKFALAGVAPADQALKDLIAERNASGVALWPALATYSDILANEGPQPYRRPEGRQMTSPLTNFVVICLIMELRAQFGLLPLRHSTRRRQSICSIVSTALIEAGLSRGGESAIWKIWSEYGPLVMPDFPQKKLVGPS